MRSRLLSPPYSQWMPPGRGGGGSNNRSRKAHELALVGAALVRKERARQKKAGHGGVMSTSGSCGSTAWKLSRIRPAADADR